MLLEIHRLDSLVVPVLAGRDFKDVVLNRADLILTASHLAECLNHLAFVFVRLKVVSATTATATVALADVEAVYLVETDDSLPFVDVVARGEVLNLVVDAEVHFCIG